MRRSSALLGLLPLLVALATTQPVAGEAAVGLVASALDETPRAGRTQFVLLGFDATPPEERPVDRTGFHYIYEALNRERPAGAPRNAFTLFISTGNFQFAPGARNLGSEERPFEGLLPRNQPVIRYARTLRYIRARAANVRDMAALGVEIGSHAVRHAHGLRWSEAEWRVELADHQRISDLLRFPRPLGFRAPFLEYNDGMYAALAAHGARYDASQPGGRSWPTRHPSGIWQFSVPTVPVPGGGRALFFDDNLRTVFGGMARARGLSGRAAEDHMDSLYVDAAMAEFQQRYSGERAPLLVSGHGNFRKGILRFMRRVCELPDVRCTTFREATDYLDAHPELAGR
ncbi:MAG: polysaccharide deacetylase family protein [Myxococcales bacterium]|nr:polysaccharide deacetylase family protein [Myxococcales bacterium]MCB9628016.1 polysaccharide deacetylase family protein [Sandaracinaceae bacterium]